MNKLRKVLFLGLLILLCITIFIFINTGLYSMSNLKDALLDLGSWAPFVFLLLCIFRSFLLLPCGLFSVIGGVIFGPLYGSILAVIGFTMNSLLVYHMAGYFGRSWVKRLLRDKYEAIDIVVNKNSFISFFCMRIVPLLPFDAVSCLGGISKTKLNNFAFATLFGSIPGVFLYTYFGGALKSLSLQKVAIPAILIVIIAFAPIVYKLIYYFRYSKANIDDRDSII